MTSSVTCPSERIRAAAVGPLNCLRIILYMAPVDNISSAGSKRDKLFSAVAKISPIRNK